MDKDAMFFGDKTDPATQPITEPMHVLEKGVYRGPHYYSHTPMIRIMLDLGRMEEWPSNRIPGFVDRLIETLPGLERHGCSLKRRGGFVTRLRDGTWLGPYHRACRAGASIDDRPESDSRQDPLR
jgi:hypothetical protein